MREYVVLALVIGACGEPTTPPKVTAGSGSALLAHADARIDGERGDATAAVDIVAAGPAFDVPRVVAPTAAVALDPKDRVVVQIDRYGAISVLRFVEPATDRVVKQVPAASELHAAVEEVNGPAPAPSKPESPKGRYKIKKLDDPTAGFGDIIETRHPAGRAAVAHSTLLPHGDDRMPIVLATPQAPAVVVAKALVAAGGLLGVLFDGKLSTMERGYTRHHAGGSSDEEGWYELHVRQDGLHLISLPGGRVHHVPWLQDSVDGKALLAALDEAWATDPHGLMPIVDVLVDPVAGARIIDAQRLVDVLAALHAGRHVLGAIGVAPGAPEERAAQIAAANRKARGPSKVPAERPESDVSRVEIRRSIQRGRHAYTRCYTNELKRDPQLQGKVTISFTIGADGNVLDAKGTGMTPVMNACVAKVFSRMRFPKPTGGGVVKVSYPVTFRPEP